MRQLNSQIRSNESDRKNSSSLQLFFQTWHRANFAISPICHASFAKSKERTRDPARFPDLKGPTRRKTVGAKQAGHFPLPFNCPTLIPPSSNYKDSQICQSRMSPDFMSVDCKCKAKRNNIT